MATWLATNGTGAICTEAGHTVTNSQLSRPLQVRGVGRPISEGTAQRTFPIAPLVQDGHGGQHNLSTYTAPVIPNSPAPALLGLAALRANQAILECEPGPLHLCGPGRQLLQLPAGSRTYQLEESPSGHGLLPCSELQNLPGSPSCCPLRACSAATAASRTRATDFRIDFQATRAPTEPLQQKLVPTFAAQQLPASGTSAEVPPSTSA